MPENTETRKEINENDFLIPSTELSFQGRFGKPPYVVMISTKTGLKMKMEQFIRHFYSITKQSMNFSFPQGQATFIANQEVGFKCSS